MLTEAALKLDVPPEVIKGIAQVEQGEWKHFDEDGETIISEDGGIGLMQITNTQDYDVERLHDDLLYNIEAGVEILKNMKQERQELPTIHKGTEDYIESWYFPVMAYNGIKPVNSPVYMADGTQNSDAYQERVFSEIESLSLLGASLSLPNFTRDDFDYDSASSENIEFLTAEFELTDSLTRSNYQLTEGDLVYTTENARIREQATTESDSITTVEADTPLTIQAGYEYEEVLDRQNHFVWYPIETADGQEGYIASALIEQRPKAPDNFQYQQDEGILSGEAASNKTIKVENDTKGTFTTTTDDSGQFAVEIGDINIPMTFYVTAADDHNVESVPTEWEAAIEVDTPFTDVASDHWAAPHVSYLYDLNVINGIGNDLFGVDDELTRAQAAAILVRHEGGESNPNALDAFEDVDKDHEFAEEIDIALNEGFFKGVSEDSFAPDASMTRAEMAVLLERIYDIPTSEAAHPFTDVEAGKWYAESVANVYAAGVAKGTSEQRFAPEETITRGQYSVFLTRSMDENYRLK
nr:S-layer homology domain-containing protein [Texcoconibacillus texcoconensis]